MAWHSHQIVANMLENTRPEFGGVLGWPGCGVVDIVFTGRSVAAHCKNKIWGSARQESDLIIYMYKR
jgi:hypothetical protein